MVLPIFRQILHQYFMRVLFAEAVHIGRSDDIAHFLHFDGPFLITQHYGRYRYK